MINFNNTKVAFASKSNAELTKSYWLFKIVSIPSLVNFGKSFTDIAIKFNFPISWIIKPTIFKQFCGGENIKECDVTIEQLNKAKIGTILDYSVEGKDTEKDFDDASKEIIRTIERASGNTHIPFSVFKVTGLGRFEILEKSNENISKLNSTEKGEYQRIFFRIDQICKKAHDLGVPVFIDAEDSWIQNTIDRWANEMMEKYNKEKPLIYNTFQLYRHDKLSFLKTSFESAIEKKYYLGAKLVRGAYMEKERARALEMNYTSPIHLTKEATDIDYNLALRFCVDHIDKIGLCAGTHNENSCTKLVDLMIKKNITPNHKHIYFSQLFGMSDHISYNLAFAGYNVAKYVPYGPIKEVLPYLIRRAQENTSVKGQTGRELSLIITEKNRRNQ